MPEFAGPHGLVNIGDVRVEVPAALRLMGTYRLAIRFPCVCALFMNSVIASGAIATAK